MELPVGIKITAHYIDEDIVNAMATLGGHVMIYRGLLEKLPNENTLILLLGHEIGHVKLRHPIKALGKGVIIGLVLSTILGQSSDAVANVLADTSMVTMLRFSREQEQDSDDEGIMVMNAYYNHVQSATDLFEVLEQEKQKNGLDTPQFLSTHPDTQQRILHLTDIIDKQNWHKQGKTIPIPDNILKKLDHDRQQAKKKLKEKNKQ
jgi:predicted Zn-dependent protease